ncbi:MAG: tRNA preQ1(34) S-adenosylmethionine ribosyltransferase-isomerase QueA [Candidatus Komeilibacteria bacterium]|nr:tRNA preQ1(34) S-adenosylmethionine ribosyltransferase-isomerase QueA [Candidatus Komeilibacteria bacterium]
MKLSDFNYNLPKELIAQKPAAPRDSSRLMVLDRNKKTIAHRHFYDIFDYLHQGDVLVLNNTKVFPARLFGKRKDTGGKVEVFLLKDLGQGKWESLIGNRRKKLGQIIQFGKGLECEILKRVDESVWQVKFNKQGQALEKLIEQLGKTPIPPYIKYQNAGPSLKQNYQTVFAKYKGSVAAPTAGFHFTKKLLARLKSRGVQIEYVTLHVGLGTFAPVKEPDVKRHKMHVEWARIDKGTAERLNSAKKEGRRIIAVGTTSVRTLESFVKNNKLAAGNHWTNIFIYPGYKFKFINALITNFHLPKSTLLMLISALAGRNFILKAYQQATRKKYRFYSFGDAMFIV